MVVSRRELPRTSIAGPAVMACRIGAYEDSPLPCAIPAADHLRLNGVHRLPAAISRRALERAAWCLRLRALSGNTDGPDKPQQFSADRGDHLLLRFAFGEQLRIPGM